MRAITTLVVISVSVSASVSGRSDAFACVRLRSSLHALALSAELSSRFGWRFSQPVNIPSLSITLPVIAWIMASTASHSRSNAAAQSSHSKSCVRPRSFAFALAETMRKVKTAMTFPTLCPLLRAITRHFGSVGMSCQRRTQLLIGNCLKACTIIEVAVYPHGHVRLLFSRCQKGGPELPGSRSARPPLLGQIHSESNKTLRMECLIRLRTRRQLDDPRARKNR
jgi:hypothetical protein